MTAYETWKVEKKLEERAETLEEFDKEFISDIKEYARLLKESDKLNIYCYTKKDKSVYHFPILGCIGQMGLQNVWEQPFYTCCRYALLEYAYPEVEEGEQVLEELLERVSHAKKIISSLPQHQKLPAQEKLQKLEYIMSLVVTGLMIFKCMIEHLSGEEDSLDSKYNETAWRWKKAIEKQE